MKLAQALHEAIEGRPPIDPLTAEQQRLVQLAADCRRLHVRGPGSDALGRMSARFERFLRENRRPGSWYRLRSWLGFGAVPRPLAQRMAAAGLLVGAVGFGGAAAGVSPIEAVQSIAEFGGDVIRNLAPHDGADGSAEPFAETPSPSPVPAATMTPRVEPTPAASPPVPATSPLPPGGAAAPAGPQSTAAAGIATPGPESTPGEIAGIATASPVPSPSPEEAPSAEPSSPASPLPGDDAPATPEPSATPSPRPSPTATSTSPAPSGTETYQAAEAGSVTLRYTATSLELVEVVPAPGWSFSIEDVKARSFKVSFERDGREVEFEAALEGGVPVTTVTPSGDGEHTGDEEE